MASSTCPKCDNHNFELKEAEFLNSNFKYSYVQCNSCGAVVGVIEADNIGYLIRNLENNLNSKIDDLKDKIEEIEKKIE